MTREAGRAATTDRADSSSVVEDDDSLEMIVSESRLATGCEAGGGSNIMGGCIRIRSPSLHFMSKLDITHTERLLCLLTGFLGTDLPLALLDTGSSGINARAFGRAPFAPFK